MSEQEVISPGEWLDVDAEGGPGGVNPKLLQAAAERKTDYSVIPWRIIARLAKVMESGADKYGRFNYHVSDIEARTYIASMCRHLFGDPANGTLGWVNGEDTDRDSGESHLIHLMACCVVVESARMNGTFVDNRLEAEVKTPPALRKQE